ncbi:hypothetical protein QJQ45_020601, partial [Haematococcus lacustris]
KSRWSGRIVVQHISWRSSGCRSSPAEKSAVGSAGAAGLLTLLRSDPAISKAQQTSTVNKKTKDTEVCPLQRRKVCMLMALQYLLVFSGVSCMHSLGIASLHSLGIVAMLALACLFLLCL